MADAPKRKSKSKKSGSSSDWKNRFVRFNLTKEDEGRLEELSNRTDINLGEWIFNQAADGYKFSVNEQADGSCYIASLVDRNPESDFFDWTLNARAIDPQAATLCLFYKHTICLEGVWPSQETVSDNKWG